MMIHLGGVLRENEEIMYIIPLMTILNLYECETKLTLDDQQGILS